MTTPMPVGTISNDDSGCSPRDLGFVWTVPKSDATIFSDPIDCDKLMTGMKLVLTLNGQACELGVQVSGVAFPCRIGFYFGSRGNGPLRIKHKMLKSETDIENSVFPNLQMDGPLAIRIIIFSVAVYLKETTDFTLVTDGVQLRCHKDVVRFQSSILGDIFQNRMLTPNVIEMTESLDVVQAILNYMYTGEQYAPHLAEEWNVAVRKYKIVCREYRTDQISLMLSDLPAY